jgi:lipopolysaccharide transport protein LptA
MRNLLLVIILLFSLLMSFCVGEQVKKKTSLPPFRITADEMEIDLNLKTQVYSGNVIFKTNYNSTKLTCDKITSDSNSAKNTTMVRASGNVKVSMVTSPTDKNSSPLSINGEAPIITYFMQDDEAQLKMESAEVNGKKVMPILTSIDKDTGEKTVVTGKTIIYNQKTGKLTVKDGDVSGGEDKVNG